MKKGHFEFQTFTFDSTDTSSGISISELQGMTTTLQEQLLGWEETLEMLRHQHFFLNFVFSEQIPILFNYFKDGTKEQEAVKILEYMSPGRSGLQQNISESLTNCKTPKDIT